jgi:hypothetical protein
MYREDAAAAAGGTERKRAAPGTVADGSGRGRVLFQCGRLIFSLTVIGVSEDHLEAGIWIEPSPETNPDLFFFSAKMRYVTEGQSALDKFHNAI